MGFCYLRVGVTIIGKISQHLMAMRQNTITRLTMQLQNMEAICREFKGNKTILQFFTKEYTEYETDQNTIKCGIWY